MIPVSPILKFVSENFLDINEVTCPLKKNWIMYLTELYLLNILKLIEVYFFAFIIGGVAYTATTHLAFIALRKFCHGYHAKHNLACSFQSIVLFSLLPLIFSKTEMLVNFTKSIFLMAFILITLLSPVLTENSKVMDRREKHLSKVLALIVLLLEFIFCIFSENECVISSITCALLIQGYLLLIPVLKKLNNLCIKTRRKQSESTKKSNL